MINQALEEELIVIDSIYPEQVSMLHGSESTCTIKYPDSNRELYLSFNADYPATSPIVSGISGSEKEHYQALINELAGAEVLLTLLSAINEAGPAEGDGQEQVETEGMEQAHHFDTEWFTSEVLQDRKSTFVGRACEVTSDAEVQAALSSVEAKRATHPKIWACRYTDGNGKLVQANDDDGESAAGGRLAFLLDVTKADNVLVVVSRWFGGILLGDVRFKHISTVAREALERGGFLADHTPQARKNTKHT